MQVHQDFQGARGQIAIYQTDNGTVDVRLGAETVWLSQEQMTQLFGRERSVITKHIRNVFKEGELDEKSNVQNLHILLFVDFLHRNGRLLNAQGHPVINDVGLAALALLVAESHPAQKEVLIRLIVNMLAQGGRG